MPGEPDLARVSTDLPGEILSVSALNRSVRDLLEHRFPLLWVAGEISNLSIARSGHAYFSLKDDEAQVRCVMYRHRLQYLGWAPSEGMKVEVTRCSSCVPVRGSRARGPGRDPGGHLRRPCRRRPGWSLP
ncbi:MAG: exodeoxyribonuclease VII large subunit [Betaproteobacteria bacterium]|nr:exodeoxyribonuclease VII large subunit [Betaproteobacteria bacterium]